MVCEATLSALVEVVAEERDHLASRTILSAAQAAPPVADALLSVASHDSQRGAPADPERVTPCAARREPAQRRPPHPALLAAGRLRAPPPNR
eukprot:1401020-Prymnesium_polylepis.1